MKKFLHASSVEIAELRVEPRLLFNCRGPGVSNDHWQLAPVAYGEALPSVDRWMQEWMSARRAAGSTLHMARFVEPIYFLTRPISWEPNTGGKLQSVQVPKGFVTDLASIPRIFWSLLRPDGEYTYAAIIHDFLYWEQDQTRQAADEIFREAMLDFSIGTHVVRAVYAAARLGGERSWKENSNLKAKGEKRILRLFPEDPRMRWQDWKRRAEVFQ